jgi:hypothetical protein
MAIERDRCADKTLRRNSDINKQSKVGGRLTGKHSDHRAFVCVQRTNSSAVGSVIELRCLFSWMWSQTKPSSSHAAYRAAMSPVLTDHTSGESTKRSPQRGQTTRKSAASELPGATFCLRSRLAVGRRGGPGRRVSVTTTLNGPALNSGISNHCLLRFSDTTGSSVSRRTAKEGKLRVG